MSEGLTVSRLSILEYWKKKGLCEFGLMKAKGKNDFKVCQYNDNNCNWETIKKSTYFMILGEKPTENNTFFFCPIHYLSEVLRQVPIDPEDKIELIKEGIIKA